MLQVKSLSKRYGEHAAVDGVSLSIHSGEVLGLLGPNGAGKSTTIAIIAGVAEADSGEVKLGENGSPTSAHDRKLLGVAPQSIALYPDLSCFENLAFFGSLYGIRGSVLRNRAEALLDRVGLLDRARSRVDQLSGGMQRRLNLAAALVHSPRLLLLDEPTAGVDPHSRNAVLDLVRELRDEGLAVLYTTHYMEEAQRICDRVAIIDNGKILADGTVDELIDTHGGETLVRVTRSDGEHTVRTSDARGAVLELLQERDATGLRVDRPDLESVFFGLTGRRLRD